MIDVVTNIQNIILTTQGNLLCVCVCIYMCVCVYVWIYITCTHAHTCRFADEDTLKKECCYTPLREHSHWWTSWNTVRCKMYDHIMEKKQMKDRRSLSLFLVCVYIFQRLQQFLKLRLSSASLGFEKSCRFVYENLNDGFQISPGKLFYLSYQGFR